MSELGVFFADAMNRVCQQHCPQPVIEEAERGTFPANFWEQVRLLGIPLMLVGEESGGIAASVADTCALMEVLGSHSTPGPVLETVVANLALTLAGMDGIDRPLALALTGDRTKVGGAEAGSAGAEIIIPRVAWGRELADLVAVVRREDRTMIARLETAQCEFEPLASLTGEPEYLLRVPAGLAEWVILDGAHTHDRLLRIAAIGRCAQMIGAMEWALEGAVGYASERIQFGRAIGKFQAVQHLLAAFASDLAATSAIYSDARERFDEDDGARLAAARARAGDAVDAAVSVSHQVYAAIGFSKEHGLNFRTRRLMKWRDDFGSTNYWRERIGRQLLGKNYEEVWKIISALGSSPDKRGL